MALKIAGALTAFMAAASTAIADTAPERGWDHGHMYWGNGHGIFGGLTMLAFWGVVIALIVLVVRWVLQSGKNSSASSDALEILRARYARGELDEDEFQKRKAVLES